AHYFPLYSRLGPYEQGLLDEYVYRDRRMFEGWAHVASLLPVGHYPLVRHRMEAARETNRWFINGTTPEYIERVLEEVRERGPIVAGGLDDPGQRTGPWWGYGKGKIALEWHFRTGSLAIRERRNFARVYDLPERVFDAAVLEAPAVPRDVAEREMLRMAARAHGVGTARDLADYYRIKVPEAKKQLVELVDAGELERVRVEGWKEPGYIVA